MKKSLVLATLVLMGASQSMHGMKKYCKDHHGRAFNALVDGTAGLMAMNAVTKTSFGEKHLVSGDNRNKVALGAFVVGTFASYFMDYSWRKKLSTMLRWGVVGGYGTSEVAKTVSDKDSKKLAWTTGITAAVVSLWCSPECCDGEKEEDLS